MTNYNLKPCPFCSAIPTIRWEQWPITSDKSRVYILEADHSNECFIPLMEGLNRTGRMMAMSEERLADIWNRRANDEKVGGS